MNVTVIKENESVIYNGIIYSHGQSFEIEDSIGASLIERGYVEMTAPNDESDTETISREDELAKVAYTELKKLAARMGLSANGKRDELIARIIEAEQNPENEGDEEADTEEISEELPNTSMPE